MTNKQYFLIWFLMFIFYEAYQIYLPIDLWELQLNNPEEAPSSGIVWLLEGGTFLAVFVLGIVLLKRTLKNWHQLDRESKIMGICPFFIFFLYRIFEEIYHFSWLLKPDWDYR